MKRFLIFIAVVICSAHSLSWSNNNFIVGGTGLSTGGAWEIRDNSSRFITTGDTWASRAGHCAVRLLNGNVFLAGGGGSYGTWEIHDGTGALISTGSLWANRDSDFTCTLLPNGNVMIVGGLYSSGTWEIHGANGNLVSSTGSTGIYLWASRAQHSATLLSNGNVFIAGGQASATWEIRDGNGNLVSSTGSTGRYLWATRVSSCAVNLSNGNVFLAGGTASNGTWEVWDGNGNLVSSTGSTGIYLWASRNSGFTCSKLSNGNVFIAGGGVDPGSWEIRDTNIALVSHGTLWASRSSHKAQVQSDTGNILITGGSISAGTWELHSSNGALINTGNLNSLHSSGHSLTELLPTLPGVPTGLTTTVVSSSQINLSWNASTGATGYGLERCQGAGCTNFAQIATPTATSYSDLGLAANTTYTYQVRASNATGWSGYSNTASATTTLGNPPPAPTNLTTTVVSSSQINLSWNASTGATGYGLERCQGAGCTNFAQIATPTATSYSDLGLAANTTYTYQVRASNAAGWSGYSNTASGTTGQLSGPVAAYSFNEGTGIAVGDSSGHNNTGTINGATWTTPGVYGNALSFNGVNSYVTVPNSFSLNISGTGMTISFWVNITDGTGHDYVIMGKPWAPDFSAPYYQYGVEFSANGAKTIDFYFGDSTATLNGPFSMTPVLGAWTYVAVTYDGTTVTGYLGGVQKFSTPVTASIQAQGNNLYMGVDATLSQPFNGTLDEMRIYNRALSQSEIQTDMNTPLP